MRPWQLTLAISIILGTLMQDSGRLWPVEPALAQPLPSCTTNTPLPEAFKVAQLGVGSADEPPTWAGAFEGSWDGDLQSRFIVERLDGTKAHIVYTWGDEPSGAFKAGFSRFAANLRED